MNDFDYDIGIIGGGAAGLTVAAGAAQLGAKTLLIEKHDSLGGDCLHHGCVPSKTLIHSARLYHQLGDMPRFGLPSVERPPVDFSALRARIDAVISQIQEHDSPERFQRLGASIVFGAAVFTDEHTVTADGKDYTAAKWVIATGSSPAFPAIDGIATAGCLTNREIFSLERLPGSLVILGGGPIAIEMAQAFRRLGTEVDVIQRSRQILSREDSDLAGLVQARLAGEGVRFHLGASVLSVRAQAGMKEVVFQQDESVRQLRVEAILVAMGRTPNIRSLHLDQAGVCSNLEGVETDDRLRTNQKHIYAAGDVTGDYQFTHAAGYEGGVVISNALFHLPRKADYRWLPWCTYSDPELASIGMNEKRASAAGIEYSVWTEEFRANDRSLAEGRDQGLVKLILDRREHPLGVQILGPRAGDLIAEWVAVLHGRVRLATLAAAVHPYPTLAEINKKVAGQVLARKLFSAKVRKALAFFFNLKGRTSEEE